MEAISGHVHNVRITMTMPMCQQKNRTIARLVEEHLLVPQFTTQLILHPSNLYQLLDNEEGYQKLDAKFLFNLSKRVVKTSQFVPESSDLIAITSHAGMELLRQSFAAYSKERGTVIMKPPFAPITSPTILHGI